VGARERLSVGPSDVRVRGKARRALRVVIFWAQANGAPEEAEEEEEEEEEDEEEEEEEEA
jgi:hypothetical protein